MHQEVLGHSLLTPDLREYLCVEVGRGEFRGLKKYQPLMPYNSLSFKGSKDKYYNKMKCYRNPICFH